MTGKDILIIGAGGYIGAHLSLYLAQQGYCITALSHTPKDTNPVWEETMHQIIYGDIKQSETIEKLLQYKYDYAIYLISLNHVDSEKDIEQTSETNVLPLWKIANALKDHVQKFIYFSTQQVYGRNNNLHIDEQTIPMPVNNYGLTHLMCENITNLCNQQSSTQYINVRLSNGYGIPVFKNNSCWTLVINELCKMACEEKVIRLKSDGSPLRDFIHVSDISKAIHTLLFTENKENLYNISSGTTYTIGEMAMMIQNIYSELYHQQLPILLPEGAELKTEFLHKQIISNARLKAIGFIPEMSISKGIADTLRTLISRR